MDSKGKLSADMLAIFETGVRYQMYHCLALLLVGLLINQGIVSRLLLNSGWLFTAGIFIFSGSLYILSLSGVKAWGVVTPFGGLALLAAWLSLAWMVLKA